VTTFEALAIDVVDVRALMAHAGKACKLSCAAIYALPQRRRCANSISHTWHRKGQMTALPHVPEIGTVYCKSYTFTRENIARFIAESGDTNRLHHDEEFAKNSRFGGIIASGTQSMAVLSGFMADQYPSRSLGLDVGVRFVRAIPAGLNSTLRWKVIGIVRKDKLKGNIISLEGEIVGDDGKVYLTGTTTMLLLDEPH